MFKISPDETLKIIQELYEKKLVTYPRTDARVLSTAVSKEIYKNIGGLRNFAPLADFAAKALDSGTWKQIAKTKYVNDKQITDHYAIIPTGQGFGALRSLNPLAAKVYELIAKGEKGLVRYEFEPDDEMLDEVMVKYPRSVVEVFPADRKTGGTVLCSLQGPRGSGISGSCECPVKKEGGKQR